MRCHQLAILCNNGGCSCPNVSTATALPGEDWIMDHHCAPSPLAERKQAYLSLNWLIRSNIRESTASFLWLVLCQWYLTLMEEPASLSAGLGERMNGDWHPQRGAAAG